MATKQLLAALATGVMVAGGASAVVVGSTVADVSSEFDPNNTLQDAINTVNGSGLDTSDANPLNWTHDNGLAGGGGATGFFWHSVIHAAGNSDPEYITFDLGSNMDVNSVLIWNFNAVFNATPGGDETHRGFNQYDLSVAADGANPLSFGDFTTIITDGTLNQAGGTTTEGVQVVNVAGQANGVRYIRIDADSSFLNNSGGGAIVTGLSEVRFDVVPEPGSLALLTLGGLAMLRRRR